MRTGSSSGGAARIKSVGLVRIVTATTTTLQKRTSKLDGLPPPFAKPAKCKQRRIMKTESLSRAFADFSTPLIADAALRLKIPLRISPPGIRPVTPNQRLAAQRYRSDILEASMFFWKQCRGNRAKF